ncbi:MAG: SDR family NAD(P)-dependent oxidoreductase [Bacteroidota bacterium]
MSTNKYVLVTGASSGIGKACAIAFAKEGYNLIITARREERLIALKDELENAYNIIVLYYAFDVRDFEAVQDFATKLESISIVPYILINNAGLAVSRNKIQEGIIEDWERMIDTNVKGLLYVSRCILPMMIERNTGVVLNIGSTAGHIIYPGGNVYHAAKYAVKALNEAMNLDLVDTDIKVCSIDPGAVETEFSIVRFKGDEENAKKVYEGYEPLKASDIADIAVFVASRPAHVNIQNIIVYPTAQRSVYVHRKN